MSRQNSRPSFKIILQIKKNIIKIYLIVRLSWGKSCVVVHRSSICPQKSTAITLTCRITGDWPPRTIGIVWSGCGGVGVGVGVRRADLISIPSQPSDFSFSETTHKVILFLGINWSQIRLIESTKKILDNWCLSSACIN